MCATRNASAEEYLWTFFRQIRFCSRSKSSVSVFIKITEMREAKTDVKKLFDNPILKKNSHCGVDHALEQSCKRP